MNRLTICILLLLIGWSLGAVGYQPVTSDVDTYVVSPFSLAERSFSHQQYLKRADYLRPDFPLIRQLLEDRPAELTLKLPQGTADPVTLLLRKSTPFADGYVLTASGGERLAYDGTRALFYQGEVAGRAGSMAVVSVFAQEIRILLSDPDDGNQRVTYLPKEDIYVFYRETDLLQQGDYGDCASGLLANGKTVQPKVSTPPRSSAAPVDNSCVEMYYELDHQTFLDNGGDLRATETFLLASFNEVRMLYATSGVELKLAQVFVWTTPDPYPLPPQTFEGFVDFLFDFGSYRQNNYQGRMAQLLTTRQLHPFYYGVGFQGAAYNNDSNYDFICDVFTVPSQGGPYSLCTRLETTVLPLPNYSINLHVMAHELGHNLGAGHTHDCIWIDGLQIDDCASLFASQNPEVPFGASECFDASTAIIPPEGGTIMSYCQRLEEVGVNFSLGFHPANRFILSETVATANCVTGTNCQVVDEDGDGYNSSIDCADDDADVHPGADEVYGNQVDENCDGMIEFPGTEMLVFSAGSGEGFVNDTVLVPVRASGFSGVAGFQMTMVLPEMDQGAMVGIVPADALDNIVFNFSSTATLRVIWNAGLQDDPPPSLADSTTLFSVQIVLTGEPGACSTLDFSNVPTPIVAVDTSGNESVPLTQSGAFCKRSQGSISGIVSTEFNQDIAGITILLNGSAEGSTDVTGYYTLDLLPLGATYVVDPERNDDPTFGVNVADIILIRNHILEREILDSPYRLLAADVDLSGSISVIDMLILQQLIIGLIDSFPAADSWEFVPAAYAFPHPDTPWMDDYPTTITITALSNNQDESDFVAIKMGDVTDYGN